MLLSECICESPIESTLNLPSVIIPVLLLPNIINSFDFADNRILSEFTNIWSPVNSDEFGYFVNAIFCFLIVSLKGIFTLPDVIYTDEPSLSIFSSTKVPIGSLSVDGFCLLRINMDGDDVPPFGFPFESMVSSSVKKNSENLIVLPVLPLIIVSPSLGCKNFIFSFII